MKFEETIRDIFSLKFETQHQTAYTLLRFQEHYESPKFRGKTFTLDEFKRWYTKTSPDGKKTGKFTYCTDWEGFNLPSHVFTTFFEGRFNPLSREEKTILSLIRDKMDRKFYVIASFKKNKDGTLKHEIAHGLYYLDKEYRKQARKIINQIGKKQRNRISKYLLRKGYAQEVLEDETHAYILTDLEDIMNVARDKEAVAEANKKLQRNYERAYAARKI